MPLTAKGQEIMANLKKEYGDEHGERVFYAMKQNGQITGVDAADEEVCDCGCGRPKVRRVADRVVVHIHRAAR